MLYENVFLISFVYSKGGKEAFCFCHIRIGDVSESFVFVCICSLYVRVLF